MSASAAILERYRQPMWGELDRALRNCFIGALVLAIAVLVVVFVVPKPAPVVTTVEDMPERLARLILQKAAPVPAIELPNPANITETPKVEPKAKPKQPPQVRRTSKPKVAQDMGTAGRQKAHKEITQNLAQVSGSLDKVMADLSKSLPASQSSGAAKPAKRRRRAVRSGRSSQQLSSVQDVSTNAVPNVVGSAIKSEGVSIAAIADLTVDDRDTSTGSSASTPRAATGGRGQLRSNESLLAAVRRYAPGIQFCYDNELKRNPSLRGKLVVSVTVLASGDISEAFIVDDSLNSPAVTQCVLAQIRGWQLPAIPEGAVSFKTPFVFTPPQ